MAKLKVKKTKKVNNDSNNNNDDSDNCENSRSAVRLEGSQGGGEETSSPGQAAWPQLMQDAKTGALTSSSV